MNSSAKKDSKNVDVLVIMGRGIEYNPKTHKLRPTNLVEIQASGHHPGITQTAKLNSQNPNIFLTGSYWITKAAKLLVKQGVNPKYLIYSAGRPKYLQSLIEKYNLDPQLTEGEILQKEFNKAKANQKITQFITKDNKYSIDDIRWTLTFAHKENLRSIIFVTIDPHTKRIKVFLDHIKKEIGTDISTKVIDAFEVLANLSKSLKDRSLKKRVQKSYAYKKTLISEKKGIKDFLNGAYQSVQFNNNPTPLSPEKH